jgi:sugar/nucleoside kinase (ribokinase family)
MTYDVTVIGEIYLDHIFTGFPNWPEPDTEIFSKEYKWELGGGAVNTACALARLGRTVRLVGMVGREQMSSIERRLTTFDVSASFLIPGEVPTGVTMSLSIVDERTLFSYRGANESLSAHLQDDTELLAASAASDHVHLALPLSSTVAKQVIPTLRSQGATISLDVGHQAEWLRAGANLDILRAVDYLMPNAKEAQLMHGSVEEYLEFCREIGCHALVKLGAVGAVMLVNGQEIRATAPQVRVVDTTGAGDAFDAGFIDALLDEKTPRECLEQACICGALSTRSAGALDALPSREEIARLRSMHVA